MTIQNKFDQMLEELRLTLSQISDENAEQLVDAIITAKRIFVAGAGRSGLAGRGFAMRSMHLGMVVYVVGETTTPNLMADDLLLVGSGSGSTSSLVVMAQKAKVIGATIALVTIRPTSPIADIADIVLTIPAPSSKIDEALEFRSIQPMGSLFEQSLALTLDAVILMLMEQQTMDSDTMFTRHANLE